jgi:transposase InsO family protein
VDIWVKVVSSGFPISYSTALRHLKRLKGYKPYETNPKRHRGKYHTPPFPGDKWQMDVKFVPSECKAPGLEGRFYQYTVLDEFSRRRFLWFSAEHSMYETVRALEGGDRVLRRGPEGPPDGQRERVLRQGVQEGKVQVRSRLPELRRVLPRVRRRRAQVHPAADPRA